MKVIIIKKYKNYNIDDVVEVSDGFGKNFLIKEGYALSYNKINERNLNNKKDLMKKENEKQKEKAIILKNELEKLELLFFLKTSQNNVVHGSITSKKIIQELINKGIKIDKHLIPHVQINSLGISKIKIKLFDDVEAILNINIKGDYGK